MSSHEISAKVKAILVGVLALDQGPDTIADDANLFQDLGLDSSRMVDLLLALEEQLNLQVDPEELEIRHFETPQALAAFIAARLPA